MKWNLKKNPIKGISAYFRLDFRCIVFHPHWIMLCENTLNRVSLCCENLFFAYGFNSHRFILIMPILSSRYRYLLDCISFKMKMEKIENLFVSKKNCGLIEIYNEWENWERVKHRNHLLWCFFYSLFHEQCKYTVMFESIHSIAQVQCIEFCLVHFS